eukprot:gene2365-2402_t
MVHRPRRSALYMPGSNARALEKAKTLDADVVILDLEDAVVADAKQMAREQVCAAVRAGGFGRREVVIRINSLSTNWGLDDLIAASESGADAILVPKVSSPGDVMMCARHLREHNAPDDLRLWAMMETPLALLNAGSIAATGHDPQSRLSVMVLGTNDLAKETRARLIAGRAPMLPWMQMILAAARAHGLDLLDGVFNDLGNDAGFLAECEQGRDMGMDGKTLIHPNQLTICNTVFAPAAAEIDWAREIIAEFDLPENASKGAVQLKGRMVERLHADMARRTLAIAEAISAG